MRSLYLLIPLAILLALIAGGIFIWAVRRGQFDDLKRYEKRLPDEF